MLFDNHTHSQFSFDGRSTIEKTAASARAKGLGGICFTDHWDYYVPSSKTSASHLTPEPSTTDAKGLETFDIKAQQAEIDRVSTLCGDSGFSILKGAEIGLGIRNREHIRTLLSLHSFDEVLVSVHYLEDTDPYLGGYYPGKTWREAYGGYLETLYTEALWVKDFDVLGHFDYICRYAPYPEASLTYRDYPDLWDAILKMLADGGKALEINTKTYQAYKGGRTPELDPEILQRFKDLGGEAVSLGSDAHEAGRVGDKFAFFSDFIKACGIRYACHFKRHRRYLDPL